MNSSNSLTTLLFSVVALALVLALAWLLLKGLAALGKSRSAGSPMKIKATMPLGTRERVVVMEYRGSDYLLGVGSGAVSLIDKLPVGGDAAVDETGKQA